jgi:VWFA-related protein
MRLAQLAMSCVLGSLGAIGGASPGTARQSETSGPVATFHSAVDRVTVNVLVRDGRGRIVTNLSEGDFEVLDAGAPRGIMDFRSERAPVSVALLLDGSGSMKVGSSLADARHAAACILGELKAGVDETSLFIFDSRLRQVKGFSSDEGGLSSLLDSVEPFGMTSLYDAIGETARQVAAQARYHRGVVVLTDGLDNNSRLSAAEVSGIASSIDVPVYVVAVMSPLDRPGSASETAARERSAGDLEDLARWTGGQLFLRTAPSHGSIAAQRIVEELSNQYLIAFEPAGAPGWHPLEVRARNKNLTVRARSGYFAGGLSPDS